ncbi:MAG: hypothetical protein JWL86_3183 [Rhizobium sp.]|nr:hypothetical protein [Rhizobium sp.]
MAKPRAGRCSICTHPNRPLIESARIAGLSLDAVAAKYGAHRDAVWRHMTRHVTDDIRAQYLAEIPLAELAELAERARKENLSLLDYLSLIRSILMQEAQLAAAVHDRHGLSAISGRLTEVLKQIGTLTGELVRMAPATTTNITNAIFVNSPAFTALNEMLISRLARHPDALAAVLEGLRELEAQSQPEPAMLTLTATPEASSHAA